MYHSLVLMFKVRRDRKPTYLFEKIGAQLGRNTRQEVGRVSSHVLKDSRKFETGTAKKSFIPRTIEDWNNLPNYLREIDKIRNFKIRLKIWIKDTVPIK